MWTRARTVIGGRTWPDDWDVRSGGVTVGRVRNDDDILPQGVADRWTWSALIRPGGHGRAATLDEGLEQVRRAVLRDGLATLAPEPPQWRPGSAWTT